MSTIKALYGTQGVAITCTITSLANNGQRQSTAVDNTSNLYLDALVGVHVKANSSGTSGSGIVNVYAYGTSDNGTDYDDGATGTDGSITLSSPPNMTLIGVIQLNVNSADKSRVFSVAQAFGGVLPAKWGVVIENKSGATLDGAVGSVWYQGVQAQAV